KQQFVVSTVTKKEKKRNPVPPFITSKLQQEAARKLRFPVKKAMRVAQQLYEGVDLGAEGAVGLITYMRTDSTRIANSAAEQAQDWVEKTFGKKYLADGLKLWGGKQQKGAQEAHEAIRPTEAHRRPEDVARFLERDQLRLYELIWLRL